LAAVSGRIPRAAVAVALALAACGCSHAGESALSLPVVPRSLAVAPDFAGTIWLATGGRPYRSADGGHVWARVSGPKSGALAVAFTRGNSLLVGRGGYQKGFFGGGRLTDAKPTPAVFVSASSPYYRTDRVYALDSRGRLWVSVVAGRRWARLRAAGLPAGGVAISAVRGDVTRPDTIYVAAGRAGLWRSRDDGASFQHLDTRLADVRAVATTTGRPQLVLAGGSAIARSDDGGASFRRVGPAVTALSSDIRNWRIAFATTAGGRLLRSIDGGASWPS
jgi:hypothetical protein